MLVKYYIQVLVCLSYYVRDAASDKDTRSSLRTLCNVTAPRTAEINEDIWKKWETPLQDDLDRHVVYKTGCTYQPVAFPASFYPPAQIFDGSQFSWRGAVRARDDALVQVRWRSNLSDSEVIYNFFIGEDDNNITTMYLWGSDYDWKRHTPGILSVDRYVPFDITLRAGSLTFGAACAREVLFSREVAVEPGQEVQVQLHPWSHYGAKFLLDCPADGAERSRGSVRGQLAAYLLILSTLVYSIL